MDQSWSFYIIDQNGAEELQVEMTLVKIRSHCLLCNLLSSFGVCFHDPWKSGAFQGIGNYFHSMWPEMQGSCEQLASK